MLTDKEMYASNFDWNGSEDSRGFEDDGYFVFNFNDYKFEERQAPY